MSERYKGPVILAPGSAAIAERFVEPGVLLQYSSGIVTNIGADPEAVREKVRKLNDPGFILDEFFEPGLKKNGSIVHTKLVLCSGAEIAWKQNSGPYGVSDLGISVIPLGFAENGFARRPDGSLIPHRWLDIPYDARSVYTDASVAAFADSERTKRPGEKIFLTTNQSRRLQPESPQGGGWVHSHVFSLPTDRIEGAQLEVPEHLVVTELAGSAWPTDTALRAERGALIVQNRGFMNGALRRGVDVLRHVTEDQDLDLGSVSFGVREAAPYGIAVVFDGKEDGITVANATRPENLQRILGLRDAVEQVYPAVASYYYDMFSSRPGSFAHAYGERYGLDAVPLTDPHSRMEIVDVTPTGHLRFITAPMIGLGPIEAQHLFYERTSDLSRVAPPPDDMVKRHYQLAQAAYAQVGAHPSVMQEHNFNPLTGEFSTSINTKRV